MWLRYSRSLRRHTHDLHRWMSAQSISMVRTAHSSCCHRSGYSSCSAGRSLSFLFRGKPLSFCLCQILGICFAQNLRNDILAQKAKWAWHMHPTINDYRHWSNAIRCQISRTWSDSVLLWGCFDMRVRVFHSPSFLYFSTQIPSDLIDHFRTSF